MPTTSPKARWITAPLVGLCGLLTVGHITYYFPRTVDDTFISLRYAERWVHGLGLTFNDSGPVEGFSNPLWVALQSVCIGLGFEGLGATKVLSVLALGALFAAMFAVGRTHLKLSHAACAAALLLTASNSYVISWTMLGLETPLFLAMLFGYMAATYALIERPSKCTQTAFITTAVGLALSRPEAPLYLLTVGLCSLLTPSGTLKQRFHTLLTPSIVAITTMLALLVGRFLYYGAWLPHTYTSKQGGGFSLGKLAFLYNQGSHPLETAALALGFIASCVLAWRRSAALLGVVLSCLFFVASVEVDWMPNQRHALPIWIATSLSCVWLLDSLWSSDSQTSRIPQRVAFGVVVCLLGALAWVHLNIDSRYSIFDFRTHGRSKEWIRPKTAQTWDDAWRSVRNQTPEHVQHLSVHHHGMIQQLYHVLETAPDGAEATSWYVGRDIGRVGYYSPVQIFDTPGLFTPEAIQPRTPTKPHHVSRDSIQAAFKNNPIRLELLGPWASAAHREAHLWNTTYTRAPGNLRLRRRDLPPPSPAELRRRYTRVTQKLPSWFKISTLYGESVQGAIEKRAQYMHERLRGVDSFIVDSPPPDLVPKATLDQTIRLHGCTLSAPSAPAGGSVELVCTWETLRSTPHNYTVFVHLFDARGRHLFSADHPPVGDWFPTSAWKPGNMVQSTATITIKPETPPGRLELAIGLFRPKHRATITPTSAHDGHHRARGLTLEIVPK